MSATDDWAHGWTDEQIDSLRKRFREVYAQAEREMSDKIGEWAKEYDEQNQEWWKLLESGERTEEEYKAWLEEQVLRRDWMEGMAQQLSIDATRADEKCMQMVADEVPRIFGENANWEAFDISRAVGRDLNFTIYNEDAVRLLISDAPDTVHIPALDNGKDLAWNHQHFTSSITQGILQGESIPNVTKRLMTVLAIDERAATRAARTAMTGAESAGRQHSMERAERMGIPLRKTWRAKLDGRTRQSHRELDGTSVSVSGYFVWGDVRAERPADPTCPAWFICNCFTADNLVASDSEILKSYRHKYSGKLVTINTATGVKFTCTPNHPILTASGWVGAEHLHEGSSVLITSVIDSKVPSGNPDVNHVMPSFEAIHELLGMLSVKRATALGVDFHGDVSTSDVEIIFKKRLLRVDWDSLGYEEVAKLLLKDANSLDPAFSTLCKRLFGVMGAKSCGLRCEGIALSFLAGHLAHPDVHGLGTPPSLDSTPIENPVYDVSGVANLDGEFIDGLSGKVRADHVVSIKVTYGTAQVYNLQTENGYYFAGCSDNMIVAKNCRCTLGNEVDIEGIPPRVVRRTSKLPKNVSYEDWKSGTYRTDAAGNETKSSMVERGLIYG